MSSCSGLWVLDRLFQPLIVLGKSGNLYLSVEITLKCLSIGTPKTINFPFVSNEKLMIFRCPDI